MSNLQDGSETVQERIGAAIRAVREHRGQSMAEFGAALGVTRQYVWLLESGQRDLPGTRLREWLLDERGWVREMGVRVFAVRYADILAGIAATAGKLA